MDEDLVRYSKQFGVACGVNARSFSVMGKIPSSAEAVLKGHTNVVNNLRWHPDQ